MMLTDLYFHILKKNQLIGKYIDLMQKPIGHLSNIISYLYI